MASLNTQLLTLLDPEEKHSHYDLKISPQIFVRFMDTEPCYKHVGDRAASSRWDNHFFLPRANSELTRRLRPCSSLTYFYLYCDNQMSTDEIRKEFLGQSINKIFTVNELPFYLYQAGIEILFHLSKNPPEELNDRERDELVAIAKQHLCELRKLFNQFMTEKLGLQASDH